MSEKSLRELNRELTELVNHFQKKKRAPGSDVEQLLDEAVGLVTRAGEPRYALCPIRICAYDQLISVYNMIDEVGYAPIIEQTVRGLLDDISPTSACLYCLSLDLAASLMHQGRTQEGVTLMLDNLAKLPQSEEHWIAYYGSYTCLNLARLAQDLNDGALADQAMERAVSYKAMFRNLRPSDVDGIADMQELIDEVAVFQALAHSNLDNAIALYQTTIAPVKPNAGRLSVQLYLIDHILAAERYDDVRPMIEDMVAYVDTQGLFRDGARVYLKGFKVALRTGEETDRWRKGFKALEGKLKSTDLQAAFARLEHEESAR